MGGDGIIQGAIEGITISIHTTRVGGDHQPFPTFLNHNEFQSTPPVWVVTLHPQVVQLRLLISIHTTRVGGDSK